MGIILDAILIGILILCIFLGIKNGLVRTVFSMLSFIVALILTIVFAPPVTQMAEHTPIGQELQASIQTSVSGQIDTLLANTENPVTNTTEGILDALQVPQYLKQSLFMKSDFNLRNTEMTASLAVANALSHAYIGLIVSVLLLIVLLILLRLLRFVAEQIFKLPLLREANRIVGGVAGAVNGVFVCFLVLFAINALSAIPALGFLVPIKEASLIYKNIYETNILMSFLV